MYMYIVYDTTNVLFVRVFAHAMHLLFIYCSHDAFVHSSYHIAHIHIAYSIIISMILLAACMMHDI